MSKRPLQVTLVLSWFNGTVAGFFALFGLLMMTRILGLASALVPVVMLGSIVLHSYAALQLRRSLLNPAIPLGSQTPVGVRFLGYISLFVGVLYGGFAMLMFQNTGDMLKQYKEVTKLKDVDPAMMAGPLKGFSVFLILFSLSIVFNVFLNLRLLRYYSLWQSQRGKDS